ncbi:hypothetical protein EU642_21860 [Salmonella enterica]|nr:hypothetical protein [Salmonella enterica]EAO0118500.1 hypothetical protein [Salmonella enterica]EAO3601605.1 hypothetical protein [Salmonella enterica]EAR6391498.1 hypothetical protein [Salmonella enterica]EAV1285262.1 hypothetical protein [Salmonella enterica]
MTTAETTTHAVPPVTGYRPLSDADVDLMNRIKAKATELLLLIDEIAVSAQNKGNELWAAEQNAATLLHAAEQENAEPQAVAAAKATHEAIQARFEAFQRAEPHRWASIGRTDIQKGVMALVRAVAQPDSLC